MNCRATLPDLFVYYFNEVGEEVVQIRTKKSEFLELWSRCFSV